MCPVLREEAEDVAQEALVKAYLKLDKFAGGSSFYTWLYRIAFNTAISRRRVRRGEQSIEQTRELTGNELIDGSESADQRMLRRERACEVHQAMNQLPEEFRSVLVLREVEGCDYDTIAEILDLPVGTVRSRLHRARLQLKEQLIELLAEKREQD